MKILSDISDLSNSIRKGSYDLSLRIIEKNQIPKHFLIDLFELIFKELVEMGERDTARSLLWNSDVIGYLRFKSPGRFKNLEKKLSILNADNSNIYDGQDRQSVRNKVADDLEANFIPMGKNLLLSLVNQALRFRVSQGLSEAGGFVDFLGQNTVSSADLDLDEIPQKKYAEIKFGKKHYAECAVISKDGKYFATGTVDGFVEFWNLDDGQFRIDLPYQSKDDSLMLSSAVLCMAFSDDSTLLAAGSQSGQIKIWDIISGTCIRIFEKAHDSVNCLSFSPDGSQVLCGGHDGKVRIFGLKSGRPLKEFSSSKHFINDCSYFMNGEMIVSGGADGILRISDTSSSQMIFKFTLDRHSSSINSIQMFPRSSDKILVSTSGSKLYLINSGGKIEDEYEIENDEISCCAISPNENYIYACSKSTLYAFSVREKSLFSKICLDENNSIFSIVHHPRKSVIVSLNDRGRVGLWN